MPAASEATRFDERELSVPADLEYLLEAREFADKAAADFGFEPPERAQIKVATNEAVTNAIEHGSRTPGDAIALRAVEEAGALAIYVMDGGRFVPRMLRGELPERGRGLAFMDLLMDEVEVRPGANGTRVRLLKRLQA